MGGHVGSRPEARTEPGEGEALTAQSPQWVAFTDGRISQGGGVMGGPAEAGPSGEKATRTLRATCPLGHSFHSVSHSSFTPPFAHQYFTTGLGMFRPKVKFSRAAPETGEWPELARGSGHRRLCPSTIRVLRGDKDSSWAGQEPHSLTEWPGVAAVGQTLSPGRELGGRVAFHLPPLPLSCEDKASVAGRPWQ